MEFISQLHPLIVHFPVALLISYLLLELGGVLLKKEYLHSVAFILLAVGVAAALFSALTGNQAFEYLKPILKNKPKVFVEMIELHEQYATLTLWYFLMLLVLRTWLIIKKKFVLRWKIICILLGLIGCFLIVRTGLLGGHLVYEYGIGTKLFLK